MTPAEFRATMGEPKPPPHVTPLVEALWWDAKGDWKRAHEIAQDIESPDGAWVHAYLHRKEGDAPNAGYWYQRAGRAHSRDTLETEWDQIAATLLTKPS